MATTESTKTTRDEGAAEAPSNDDCRIGSVQLDPHTCEFYRKSMRVLDEAEVPYLVGGAFALECYTGISRHTKDFDLFVRPQDVQAAIHAFEQAGYKSEMVSPLWIAKAYQDDLFVDLIFSSGSSLAEVDDAWFERAVSHKVLGVPSKLCPAEEVIFSKAFVMERERYDGADIAHLFLKSARTLDWQHLINRFGSNWRVLFNYLTLFGFIYPSERNSVPAWVMHEMMRRMDEELNDSPPTERIMQGTLISRQQFNVDIEEWGFKDARLKPWGDMTPEEIYQLNADLRKTEQEKQEKQKAREK